MAIIYSLTVNGVKTISREPSLSVRAELETDLEAIGRRLLWFRKALDISQASLCRRTGIATNTYNQWEKGKRRPDVDEAKKLLPIGCTLDWIYAGSRVGLPGHILDHLPVQGK